VVIAAHSIDRREVGISIRNTGCDVDMVGEIAALDPADVLDARDRTAANRLRRQAEVYRDSRRRAEKTDEQIVAVGSVSTAVYVVAIAREDRIAAAASAQRVLLGSGIEEWWRERTVVIRQAVGRRFVSTVEPVVPVSPIEDVGAGIADEKVIAAVTAERVIPAIADCRVIFGPAGEDVVALATVENCHAIPL
jgi:hypothetical protein